jgi:hypothetical protein
MESGRPAYATRVVEICPTNGGTVLAIQLMSIDRRVIVGSHQKPSCGFSRLCRVVGMSEKNDVDGSVWLKTATYQPNLHN